MNITLRELSLEEGLAIYEMIQEFGEGENGFTNRLYSATFDIFKESLKKYVNHANGVNVSPDFVPQTIYWLYIDGIPIGYGKLRHYLNEKLLQTGGHIGYTIRPSERNKGYGKIILTELLTEAKRKGIDDVLITCDEINVPSRKIIESNGGNLAEITDGICKYWILH